MDLFGEFPVLMLLRQVIPEIRIIQNFYILGEKTASILSLKNQHEATFKEW